MESNKKQIALSIVLIAAVGSCYAFWPDKYGDISDAGYKLTMAVESACGRQDVDGVQQVRTLVQTDGSLSHHERKWLNEILVAAESGSWNDARRMARDLMRAQIADRKTTGRDEVSNLPAANSHRHSG